MRTVFMAATVVCGMAWAGSALAQDSVQNGSNAAKASTEVVSLLADPSGAYTTAAAMVAWP